MPKQKTIAAVLFEHGLISSSAASDDVIEGVLATLYECRRSEVAKLDAAQVEAMLKARKHLAIRLAVGQLGIGGLPSAPQVWL